MHALSENASSIIEFCRAKVADFIGCEVEQLIFTRGATESINLVALVGLSSAIDYLQQIGYEKIIQHEKKLHHYLTEKINSDSGFKIISHSSSKSLVSFYSDKIHCHDVASILAQENIAVRAGHHCAQPCLNAVGIKHCLRASIGLYNDFGDIDRLVDGLNTAEKIISRSWKTTLKFFFDGLVYALVTGGIFAWLWS